MPGCVDCSQPNTVDIQGLVIRQIVVDAIGPAELTHDSAALRGIAQRSQGGHVIGMCMRIQRMHQTDIQLCQQLQIGRHLLTNRVHEQGFAATSACQQIAVGSLSRVEQLPKNHAKPPLTRFQIM